MVTKNQVRLALAGLESICEEYMRDYLCISSTAISDILRFYLLILVP